MKLSKLFHVVNVIVGMAGIIVALVAVSMGADAVVWGINREHMLFCSGLLMVIAIWIAISTIHHMKLEEKGELI
jgi:hypothetical protein